MSKYSQSQSTSMPNTTRYTHVGIITESKIYYSNQTLGVNQKMTLGEYNGSSLTLDP